MIVCAARVTTIARRAAVLSRAYIRSSRTYGVCWCAPAMDALGHLSQFGFSLLLGANQSYMLTKAALQYAAPAISNTVGLYVQKAAWDAGGAILTSAGGLRQLSQKLHPTVTQLPTP